MSDTLIKLIEKQQNEKRTLQKQYFIESTMAETKINLLNSYIKKEFKNGIPYNLFLKVINNEIINCILYDLIIYEMVVINLGKKTLFSMLNNIDFDLLKDKFSITIPMIKNHIINIINVYFKKEGIMIILEVSDNEGRMIIKPKDRRVKLRPNIKFIDFSLYDYVILDPVLED